MIFDEQYFLWSVKNGSIIPIDLNFKEIDSITLNDIYIETIDKKNNKTIYNILNHKEENEKKEIENIRLKENYFKVNYQDSTYDIYNLIKNINISQNDLVTMDEFGKEYLIFSTKENWYKNHYNIDFLLLKVYYSIKQKFPLFPNCFLFLSLL